MNGRSILRSTLNELLRTDPAILVLGEIRGGLNGETSGLELEFSDRFRLLPMSDRGIAAYALGLALAGKKPIVELSNTGRLAAITEVLAEAGQIAKHGEFPLTLVFRVPYGGQAGPDLDREILASIAAISGIELACAGQAGQFATLLHLACQSHRPVILLEPREFMDESSDNVEAHASFPIAQLVHQGEDLSILSWGVGIDIAHRVQASLEQTGRTADILQLVSLGHPNLDLLGARVRATGRLLVIAPRDQELGHRISRSIAEVAFEFLEAPPTVCSGDPTAALAAAHTILDF